MEEIKKMLGAILENQQITNAKLDALALDVRKLQGEMKEVKEDIRTLKEDIRILKEDVRILKEDVRVLKEDMAEVKTRLARVEDNTEFIKHKMFEHEKDIYFLKMGKRVQHMESGLD